MNLDLSTVKAKQRCAAKHLDAVKHMISSRLTTDNYGAVGKVNPDSTRYSFFFRAAIEFPFEDLALVAGDCIHNLRSALDHLIYSVGVAHSKSDPPPGERELAFPITDSDGAFDAFANRRLKTVPHVWACLKRLQPKYRPHAALPPLLRLLREFDDADKHRLLNLAFASVHTGHMRYENVPPRTPFQIFTNMGPLENGAEIAALIFDRPTPNVKHKWEGDLIIAIRHECGPGGSISELAGVLRLLQEEVQSVISEVCAEI